MSGIELSVENFLAIKQRLEFRYISSSRATSWYTWLKGLAINSNGRTREEAHVARKLLKDEESVAGMGEQFQRLHGLMAKKAPEVMQKLYEIAFDKETDKKTALQAIKEIHNRSWGRSASGKPPPKHKGAERLKMIGELIAEDQEYTHVIDTRSANVKKRESRVPADGGTEKAAEERQEEDLGAAVQRKSGE